MRTPDQGRWDFVQQWLDRARRDLRAAAILLREDGQDYENAEFHAQQVDKIAHLPELRFALGEPDVDTTSVDTAALALEAWAYYLRRVGFDGFQIRHQPTLKKVVSDRRASRAESGEI